MFGKLNVFFKYLKGKNNEKGIAMTLFLMLLPLMLAFFAFAIDVSILLHEQYRLELAARHAAYSGAVSIIRMRDEGGRVNRASAVREAQRVFGANIGGGANANVRIPNDNGYVDVNATIQVPQYFMPIIGSMSSEVSSNRRVPITRRHRIELY